MPICSFYSKNNIVIPVHQIISLPSSPLKRVTVVELKGEGGRRLGLPRGCQMHVTGNVHFILSVEGKMSYMSVRVV